MAYARTQRTNQDWLALLAQAQGMGRARHPRGMMMQPPAAVPVQAVQAKPEAAPPMMATPVEAPVAAPQPQAQPMPSRTRGGGMMMQPRTPVAPVAKKPGLFGGLDAAGWANVGAAISSADNLGAGIGAGAQQFFAGRTAMKTKAEQDELLSQMNLTPAQQALYRADPESFWKSQGDIATAMAKPQTDTFWNPATNKWEKKPLGPMAVANGTDIYDPEAGKSIYTNAADPDPIKAPNGWMIGEGGKPVPIPGWEDQQRRIAAAGRAPTEGAARYRWATPDDIARLGLAPGTTGQINTRTNEFEKITDAAKGGNVPASVITAQNKYLDAQDAESARLGGLLSDYQRFNELAKGYNSQGAGPIENIGQMLSMKTSTLNTITSGLIGKMRSPGEGVMTNADADRLKNATVSVNNTAEGNELSERVVMAAASRAQDRAVFLRQWVADNGDGSLNNAKLAWNKYAESFPIFGADGMPSQEPAPDPYAWATGQGGAAPQAPAPVAAQPAPRPAASPMGFGGGSPQPQGGTGPMGFPARPVQAPQEQAQNAEPVRITSAAQRDALPPGTPYIAPDGSVRIKQ